MCVIVVLILLVLAAGGVFLVGRLLPKGGGQNADTDGTELPGENVAATEEVTEQPQTEVQTDPVEEQAAQLVSQMTLEDKIAQMFVITPNALTGYASGVTAAGDTTKGSLPEPSGGRNCVYGRQPHRPGADDHHALQYAGDCKGAHRTSGIFMCGRRGRQCRAHRRQ